MNIIGRIKHSKSYDNSTILSFRERLGVRLLLFFLIFLSFTSCTDEAEDVDSINKQTVLVFMPWSGSTSDNGLYSYFLQNLDSIESAISTAGSMSGRVLVFISTSSESSTLYEITYENNEIQHTTLQNYSGNIYTTSSGITQILNDVQNYAYALNYGMIIGCHGCGWTFKDDWENYPYRAKLHNQSSLAFQGNAAKAQSSKSNAYPTTRFYGSVSDNNYATDITTLAQGIAGAGMKMQYILFDDCYMANVETAYELKDVTNYLIGSTSEVMAVGMPYKTMWSSLASATPAYESAVNAFYSFYSNFEYPYGTIAAIDCRKMDKLAEQMRMINSHYSLADSLVDSLQVLDGFNTPLFYDMGDYVANLCTNTDILNDFNSTLSQVVKASAHTDSIYSYLYFNNPKFIKINHFSGITISDPSKNSVVLKGREKTAWWRDTHGGN